MKELENKILCPCCGGAVQVSYSNGLMKTLCSSCHNSDYYESDYKLDVKFNCPACFSPLISVSSTFQICSNPFCYGYFISPNLSPNHHDYSLFELGHKQCYYYGREIGNILTEIVYNHYKKNFVFQKCRYYSDQFGASRFVYYPKYTLISQLFINVFKRLYNERT